MEPKRHANTMKYMNILQTTQNPKKSLYWLILVGLLLMASACSWDSPYQSPNSSNSPQVIGQDSTQENQESRPDNTVITNAEQERMIQTAINQIGVPYHYGGNNPNGFDCSGLVQYSFAEAGITVPRTTSRQLNFFTKISRSELQAGDLVFFKTSKRQLHVGIMLNSKSFVHAPSSGKEVTTAKLANPYWKSRFLKAGRYY